MPFQVRRGRHCVRVRECVLLCCSRCEERECSFVVLERERACVCAGDGRCAAWCTPAHLTHPPTHAPLPQAYESVEEGQKLLAFYRLFELPATLVIDPVTGGRFVGLGTPSNCLSVQG